MCLYEKEFDVETNLEILNNYVAGLYTIAVESNGGSERISIAEFSALFLPVRDAVYNIYRDFKKQNEELNVSNHPQQD